MTAPLQPPVIVHHMAALDASPYPPNALEGVRACLEAGARFIEIDVTPLRADDYLLVHDDVLEHETSGSGPVSNASAGDIASLHIKHRDTVTPYTPALLSQVVALMLDFGGEARLQIDYKSVLPMADDEPLRRLLRLIEPLGTRVLVSSGADWHLRRLRALAGWLDLGFDIGFYLDYRPQPADPRLPPFRAGAYGYHDDHIVAGQRLLPTPAYLAERCDILRLTTPGMSTWYVHHLLISRMLDDGFNLADWLHGHDIRLDAWTLDVGRPTSADALRLRDAGVDQFTTNTPVALGQMLGLAR
ncbi:MAG: glycerophosphodiester phosphodiesterase [Pleurocapsa minor GSE-CHR-MK-17-07R]|nr:glycerophosphodiester phosphodiesterase [Pleurocapsa minor GSE-CHR-MK 17-07R]